MPGPWKEWKSKGSFPTLSTAPWKSRKHREIPTFPQLQLHGAGKVENQTPVSHFPNAARDDDSCFLPQTQKHTQNLKPEPTRGRVTLVAGWAILDGQSGPSRMAKRNKAVGEEE
jgi:hypothetical protein